MRIVVSLCVHLLLLVLVVGFCRLRASRVQLHGRWPRRDFADVGQDEGGGGAVEAQRDAEVAGDEASVLDVGDIAVHFGRGDDGIDRSVRL